MLGARGWTAVAIIAAGAQAIATILFTASFSIAAQHQVFAETFVLQQTQPLIAIVLAWIVLGERRRPWFWPAAGVAVVAVYMVVFASDPLITPKGMDQMVSLMVDGGVMKAKVPYEQMVNPTFAQKAIQSIKK